MSQYDTLIFFWQYWGLDSGVWTQGFVLAKQALYSSSHASSPFCSGYLEKRFLVLPHSVQTMILLFYTSQYSWDDRSSLQHQLLVQIGLTNFLPRLASNGIFLISASQVASIICVNHGLSSCIKSYVLCL
jgi:hypothetical protein